MLLEMLLATSAAEILRQLQTLPSLLTQLAEEVHSPDSRFWGKALTSECSS